MKRFVLAATATVLLLSAGAGGIATAQPVAGKSVVGGSTVSTAQVPYVVSLSVAGRFLCTGSLISPTRVLTAGHCIIYPQLMTVRVGSPSARAGGRVVEVASAVRHPGYRGTARVLYNDIAVLRLAEPVDDVPPIALATPTEDPVLTGPGTTLLAAGYGQSQGDMRRKERVGTLRAALQYSRPSLCRRTRQPLATNVCTVGQRFGTVSVRRKRRDLRRSPCHGDSGGPLINYGPDRATVVGVISRGTGPLPPTFDFIQCGLQGQAAVYTRVSAYLDFILSV